MKFETRPRYIDALRWEGDNVKEMVAFLEYLPYTIVNDVKILYLHNFVGVIEVLPGQWVIKEQHGSAHKLDNDIFTELYKEA